MADEAERKFDAAVATRAIAALSAAFPPRSPLLPPPMRSFIWWSDAPAPAPRTASGCRRTDSGGASGGGGAYVYETKGPACIVHEFCAHWIGRRCSS